MNIKPNQTYFLKESTGFKSLPYTALVITIINDSSTSYVIAKSEFNDIKAIKLCEFFENYIDQKNQNLKLLSQAIDRKAKLEKYISEYKTELKKSSEIISQLKKLTKGK